MAFHVQEWALLIKYAYSHFREYSCLVFLYGEIVVSNKPTYSIRAEKNQFSFDS